jgi:L-malate glycosyltransferase
VIARAVERSPAARPRPVRPKVVHVVVAGEVGGAERMMLDLASHPELSDADHVVALMTPSARLSRIVGSAGLAVRDRGRVRESAAAFLWRALGPRDTAWLEEVLRAERADVVHLHTLGSQVVGTRAALRVGARILRTEHSSRVYVDATCWPFSRWSLARADRVVAISRHIERVVLARDPTVTARLALVSNGVDTARFAPRSARPAAPPGAFTFVVVGRLERRKGVDLAIEAIARVPGARLEVVGDGCEREALERQASATGVAGRVRFHGHLDDTRGPLERGHVAVCSSRDEGLGIALLEAMAMELPVVALPVGGVPEFVVEGRTGWLASDRTSEALARRMRDAMQNDGQRRSLGRAARTAVVDGYSMQAMCEGYGALYAMLARSGREVRLRAVGP